MYELQKKYEVKICELVNACHRVAELNYVASSGGNLSYRVDDNVMLITPTKTYKRKVGFEDICIIDLDGNVLYAADGKKPTGEWPFHTRIMQKRKDVKAIVHAHPPVLTGFAIAGDNMLHQAFLPEMLIEIGPLVTVKYATPLSQELSDEFEHVIDQSNGFLMENHGAAFLSPNSIEDAVELLEMSECMAISVLTAKILGNAKPLNEEQIRGMDEVLKVRNLRLPGNREENKSVYDLYK